MTKDFSQLFEIIRNKFIALQSGKPITMKELASFLGHEHDGKVYAWRKGQWPSTEDIEAIHEKLGFAYKWLLTGEGEAFENEATEPQPTKDEVDSLKKEIDNLRNELTQERALNRQLTARMLSERGMGTEVRVFPKDREPCGSATG